MDRPTEQVFKGFLGLTPKQKQDLIDAINDYYNRPATKQRELEESYRKAVLGPLIAEVCKCCGR